MRTLVEVTEALAAIGGYRRLNLVDRACETGAYLAEKLQELKSKHPSIGDVRGLGLFHAVEPVRNRQTWQPFNTMRDKVAGTPLPVDAVAGEMSTKGVSVQAWLSHFVIAPPLIISRREIDQGVRALDESLHMADRQAEG